MKKWSIYVVCEHFEPFHNAAMDTKIVFEIGSRHNKSLIVKDYAIWAFNSIKIRFFLGYNRLKRNIFMGNSIVDGKDSRIQWVV